MDWILRYIKTYLYLLIAGTHNEDGEVEIAFVLDCPCEFMCIYQNYQEKKFKCYCAPNLVLDDDGLHCVGKWRVTFRILMLRS